jgi:hypothetical protein
MHFKDGDAGLQFKINKKQQAELLRELGGGKIIAFAFPNDKVAGWLFSLDGADTIGAKFTDCLKNMK